MGSQDLVSTWLITMGDRFRPLNGVGLDPLEMAFSWLINGGYYLLNGGDPNYLLTGMILQVGGWPGDVLFMIFTPTKIPRT